MSSLFTGVRWGGRGSDGRPPDNGDEEEDKKPPPSNPWANVTGPLNTQPWMGDDWIDPGTNWWDRMPSLPYAEPEPEPEPEEEVLGGTGAEEVWPPQHGDGPNDPGRDFHGSSRSYDSFGDWMDAAFGDMANSDLGMATGWWDGPGGFSDTAVGSAIGGIGDAYNEANFAVSDAVGFNVGAAMTGFSIGNAVMPGIGGIIGAFAGAALADQPVSDTTFGTNYGDDPLDPFGGPGPDIGGGGGGDGYGGPGGSAVGTGRGWDRPDPGSGYSPSPGGDGPGGGGGGGGGGNHSDGPGGGHGDGQGGWGGP